MCSALDATAVFQNNEATLHLACDWLCPQMLFAAGSTSCLATDKIKVLLIAMQVHTYVHTHTCMHPDINTKEMWVTGHVKNDELCISEINPTQHLSIMCVCAYHL